MRTAPLAALLLCVSIVPVALFGCGSSDKKKSPANQSATGVDLSAYKGVYIAKLSKADLRKRGATEPDFPGGVWTMTVAQSDPSTIRLEPGGFDLKAVSLSGGRITFAPDTSCPTVEGRTKQSVFTIQTTSIGLRFASITPSCKSDAAALTLGEWRKA